MKPEKKAYLLERFPTLLRGIDERCGISTKDGWNDLIEFLLEDIQAELDAMSPEDATQFQVDQIKQKFGGLRFYMNQTTDQMVDLIQATENASYKTCEECGMVGCPSKIGWWVTTLCDPCYTKKVPSK